MDLIKHNEIFSPTDLTSIAVIGAGSVGSAIALTLAKLGIKDLVLIDGDTIEDKNIPNQVLYGPSDIGMLKVDAAVIRIERLTGSLCTAKPYFVTSKSSLRYDIVFVCVDSMEARKLIFERIYLNGYTTLYIEIRVGAYSGMVYAFNPCDVGKVKDYNACMYTDKEVSSNTADCGTVFSLAPTVQLAASYAVWMFMQKAHGKVQTEDTLDVEELMFSVDPYYLTTRKLGGSYD